MLVPRRALFVGVRDAQHGFLAERLAQQLQANGQLRIFCKSARHAHAADARKVAGNREDVG